MFWHVKDKYIIGKLGAIISSEKYAKTKIF